MCKVPCACGAAIQKSTLGIQSRQIAIAADALCKIEQ
jgi:hypothetical protein